jgi:opacity protein-like surface antigen
MKAVLAISLLTGFAMQAVASDNFYVLGGVGAGFLNDAKVNDNGEVEDATDVALRLGAGYQFNQYLGTEANYFYYTPVESDVYDGQLKTSAQSVALLAVAKYPIENFALYAKAGPSYTWKKAEFSDSDFFNDQEDTEEEWDLAYGGGVEYNFTETLATQVEYLVTDEDTSAATANLVFRF